MPSRLPIYRRRPTRSESLTGSVRPGHALKEKRVRKQRQVNQLAERGQRPAIWLLRHVDADVLAGNQFTGLPLYPQPVLGSIEFHRRQAHFHMLFLDGVYAKNKQGRTKRQKNTIPRLDYCFLAIELKPDSESVEPISEGG